MAAMYSRSELSGRGFGPHEVWVIENYFLTLKDGVRIALKAWMPVQAKDKFKDAEARWTRQYCEAAADFIPQKVG